MTHEGRRCFLVCAHCYVWLLALVTCLVPYLMADVGYSVEATCWLRGWSVFAFFVPLYTYQLGAFSILVYTALVLRVFVQRTRQDSQNYRGTTQSSDMPCLTAIDELVSRQIVFIIFFLGNWLLQSFEEVASRINPHGHAAWLAFASALYLGANGATHVMLWTAVYATNWLSVPGRRTTRGTTRQEYAMVASDRRGTQSNFISLEFEYYVTRAFESISGARTMHEAVEQLSSPRASDDASMSASMSASVSASMSACPASISASMPASMPRMPTPQPPVGFR